MERVKGSKEENLPKGYFWDSITNLRVDTNNSAVFDNGHLGNNKDITALSVEAEESAKLVLM